MGSIRQNSLLQRVVTAVVLLALLLSTLVYATVIAWYGLSLLFIVLAAWEWGKIVKGPRTGLLLSLSSLILGLLYVTGLKFMSPGLGMRVEILGLWLCTGACAYWLFIAPWQLTSWRSVKSGGGFLAIVLLLPAWIAVAQLRERGLVFLLTCLAIVWLADTAAYFSGRAFGKAKLAPSISPAKSWAGVYGAVIAVVAYFLVLAAFVETPNLPRLLVQTLTFWGLIPVAIALTAWSVIGDLFESKLKRECQEIGRASCRERV